MWPWPAVIKCKLHIYIVPSVDWYIIIGKIGQVVSEEKWTQTTTRQTYKFTKSKYFVTLTCSHRGVKIKMKCTLYIYIVPSVDWCHHWRNRSNSLEGEANTNYYPVKHLNSQNCILWPWPAVMEGSRSKWSARCTSMLFPKLIGIIIGEIGQVVSEEKRTQTTTRQQNNLWRTDGRMNERTEGHTDYYMAALRDHNYSTCWLNKTPTE